MSFITSPGVIVPPLTAGGVAYGTGSQAKVTSAGTVGQVLTSNGAGVPTFTTPASGGVTSVAMTVPSVLSVSGSPITSAGTLAVGYSGTALPVANGGTGATTLTANNVILGNGASAPTFVAPGASGNVLSSNGTTWASGSVSGASWVFLSTVTASSASSADIETTFSSTYDTYLIQIESMKKNALGSNDGVEVYLKIGSSYITASTYFYNRLINGTAGSAALQTTIYMTTGLNNTNNTSVVSSEFMVHVPTDTTYKHVSWLCREIISEGNYSTQNVGLGSGSVSNTGAINGVRFTIRNQTISGTFRLYGLKTS